MGLVTQLNSTITIVPGCAAHHSDANATPTTMDLGQIDLAFTLHQSGTSVTGHINLDGTLVYSQTETIVATPVGPTPGPGTATPVAQPLAIGPRVIGPFDGTTLMLTSQQFTQQVGGIDVTRQFSLVSTSVISDELEIEGTYRETIWGYTPQPSTVVGTFRISRPLFVEADIPGQGIGTRIYLPVIVQP